MLSLNRQELAKVFVSRAAKLTLVSGIFMDVPNTMDHPIDNAGQSPSGHQGANPSWFLRLE